MISGRYISTQGEGLRLDVDGRYPQHNASGQLAISETARHWVSALSQVGSRQWVGEIWYPSDPTLPYSRVTVTAAAETAPGERLVSVTFTGEAGTLTREYTRRSDAFRRVNLEFDRTPDASVVTEINTCAHPNRPDTLVCEDLSIEGVFERAGFSVSTSGDGGVVPLSGAGTDSRWSDSELHDAMQAYWSRFSNAPQWALWTFWAALHARGEALGGVMFDDIGPNHRQGTAVFTESFIQNAPPDDLDPAAWAHRMLFSTAVHEIGHAFNLAHSWQKKLGTPWSPLQDNEPEARSFMNYPERVTGGQARFFAGFEYRFSDAELLFMRHAPETFVRMGDADWFDHHGLKPDTSSYRLQLRVNRDRPVFEFLEPVIVEAKLTNQTDANVSVPSTVLDPSALAVVIKRRGAPARQWLPYATYCQNDEGLALAPGESTYAALPIFAGLNGWDVSEPGVYDVHVAAEIHGDVVVAEPLRLHVQQPRSRDEESLAELFFTADVGRTLVFGGTQQMSVANDTLRETVHRLPGCRAAKHAAVALAAPLVGPFKMLVIPSGVSAAFSASMSAVDAGGAITERPARVDEAAPVLRATLGDPTAAETFGHIGYRRLAEDCAATLARQNAIEPAAELQQLLYDALSRRGVLQSVLDEVGNTARAYLDAEHE